MTSFNKILSKALSLKGLTKEEVSELISTASDKNREAIFATARRVKEKIYGNRIVIFAPLYLSNDCNNDCLYCAFRRSNQDIKKITLSPDEIEKETVALLREGHKRLLVVASEGTGENYIGYLEKAIARIYKTNLGAEKIRRVNVNIAPLTAKEFQRLKKTGIGTYQVFQETYHRETYAKMHPSGPKADYTWRYEAPLRAIESGIDDIGIGALFGLYDWRFEVMALIDHIGEMEKRFGIGPHTISVPRIEPAQNAPAAMNPPAPVSDEDFKLIVAVLRLAVPYTGIILSTRECAELRDEVIDLGISQISIGSSTSPGGYAQKTKECGQFSISDMRSPSEMIASLIKHGHIPSFCTACYRKGRTGEAFMKLAKGGHIKRLCLPNCLLTLKEYLLDHSKAEEKKSGNQLIEKTLTKIVNRTLKAKLISALKNLESGQRDIYL